MKILLTTPTYPPFNSGLGNAVYQQASALASQGYTVVVATAGEKRSQRIDKESGVIIEEFLLTGADSLLNPIKGDKKSYIEFLVNSNFDVVVMEAWQNWATDLALKISDKTPGEKFLYSHGLSTDVFFLKKPFRSAIRYLFWRPYRWNLSKKIQHLDGIIFLANGGSDSRFTDLRVARKTEAKISVIPNTLSKSAIDVLERPSIDHTERKQLISVGSYHWQKGFDFVLKAYAKSEAKNKRVLKIFGQTHSKYSNNLYRLSKKLGINPDYVQFFDGFSEAELMEEYAKSYLFISGSHTECQPLVLLNANASSTPFVARATGCISSMPGGVTVNSVTQAADSINALLSNEALWLELNNAGRKAALERYHSNQTTPLLIKTLLPKLSHEKPLVSIILPVFNGGPHLALAINSIINQSYSNWELILMDDGSTDGAVESIKAIHDSRIKVFSDGVNKGLATRLNEAVHRAKGIYIARMDSDDICFPERLEKQVKHLQKHPEIDLLGCRALVFRSENELVGLLPFAPNHKTLCSRVWRNIPLPHPTWMGKREWFIHNAYRIPEVMRAEDQELLLRTYPNSHFACLNDVLLGYRQGSFNLRRTFIARKALLAAQLKLFYERREWINAILGILATIVKCGIDLIATLPGLEFVFFKRMNESIPLSVKESLYMCLKITNEDGEH